MRLLLLMALLSPLAQAADLLPDETRNAKQDPLYGQALFSLHSGDYENALALNDLLKKQGNKRYGRILDIHQATAQLGLGMSQQAQRQYKQLIADPRISFIPPKARSQAWFYLAKHFYNKGLWPTSLNAIREIKSDKLDPIIQDEYHFLAATLELFIGNKSKADSHILKIDPTSKWAAYAFLNLAVSYTERDIHIDKVDAVFNKALELTKNTPSPDALSDKINLMAGQFFFATGRGRSAIKHLKNVSLDSAYTPKTLLTYGWALTEQWQYHDALQPWYMLKTGYSPLNQDVQETLIAIPHLLEKLNAKVMALGAFDYASDQFDEIYKQLDESAKRLNTGEFIEPLLAQQIPDKWGAFIPVDLSLPDHPDQIYLKDVMSQGYFQGELKNLRDLHVMKSQLTRALDRLDAFNDVAATRRDEYKTIEQANLIKNKSNRLKELESRYNELKKHIDKAFKNPDGNGLASSTEKAYLQSFVRVKDQLASLDDLPKNNNSDYQQRLRRVEGVLSWELSERFNKRKKQISKNLAMLNSHILTTKKQLKAAQYAYAVAPDSFEKQPSQIAKLKAKLTKQLTKLDKLYAKQRERVGSIVKTDIKHRQERVLEYQLQARLASARLFDETSNKQRTVASGEARQ